MQELGANYWSIQLEHDLSFSPVSPFDGQPWRAERAKLGLHGTLSALLHLELAALFQDWRVQTDIWRLEHQVRKAWNHAPSFVDPRCRRASLTGKQPLRLDGRDKSSGRRWGSPAHLASFFFRRGPNAGQILDARVGKCPSPKSSSPRHPSYRTMTLAANLDPREKNIRWKSDWSPDNTSSFARWLLSIFSPPYLNGDSDF